MDETEICSNVLGVIVDKVSLDYLFCATYLDEKQAMEDLDKKLSEQSGRRVYAYVSHRGRETLRGFPLSGWFAVVGDELKKV